MDDTLQHYGVLGMRWGVRRYQNYDGTLTSAGKKHRKELAVVQSNSNMSVRDAKTQQIKQETAKEYGPDISSSQSQLNRMNDPSQQAPNKSDIRIKTQLSDDEIRAFLARAELERKYFDVLKSLEPKKEEPKKEEPKKEEKKSSAAGDFVKKVAMTAVTTVATKWATEKLSDVVFGKKSDDSKKDKDKTGDKKDSKKSDEPSFMRQLYNDLRDDSRERRKERREDRKEREKERDKQREQEEKERKERIAREEFRSRLESYVL